MRAASIRRVSMLTVLIIIWGLSTISLLFCLPKWIKGAIEIDESDSDYQL